MGLFGALFAGVSGLSSQSNKIGIISNNISNVNTVGFKQGKAAFNTLVVPSGGTTFSPGGVIGTNQQLISQQGLISATTSATDVAITGSGMLFVSPSPAGGADNLLFTRSGSFTQDAEGNFINANGYYLQGLAIDPSTGEAVSANTRNLVTVNVSSSATGKASPTTLISLGANFDATQSVLIGPGETVTPTGNKNVGVKASTILVGDDVKDENSINQIIRGDSFQVINDGNVTNPDKFIYGGFTIGRNVTIGVDTAAGAQDEGTLGGGLGDGNNILETDAGTTITADGSTNVITITVADSTKYAVGSNMSIGGVTSSIGGINPDDLNGEWQVVSQASGTTITVAVGAASSSAASGTGDASNRTYNFAGNIMDAKSVSADFLGTTTTSPFADDAFKFSIQVANVGTLKLAYNSNPDPNAGTFNSLNTLASAINDATGSGLTATIVDGRIYISATDPNNEVDFLNGDADGNSTGSGIDWVQELDLPNSPITNINAGTSTAGVYYFNTLNGLAQAINTADPTNLLATVNNPTGTSSININEANSQQTILFQDTTSPANTGSLLQEFGFPSLTGTFPLLSTGTLAKTYDAGDPQKDMSSGAITPQFTKDITIYDSLGISHTIAFNVAKLDTATGTWAIELTAVPPNSVVANNGGGVNGDGQIAAGTVIFNGNGVLTDVKGGIADKITINWNPQTVGAGPSSITLDLGLNNTSTNGVTLTQAAGAFNVSTAQQNGSPTGQLTGVSIDSSGFVIASFSNGQTQKMFQMPLANFTNPDGLQPVSGDAFQATLASGPVNPELAGTSGVGTFAPSALEQSNVDLSTQLTDLIVAQQAYGANSKVLTIADQLLQQLDQIIQ